MRLTWIGHEEGRMVWNNKPYLLIQILEAVVRVQSCRIEELISLLPQLTWNDIFREVSRLSRTGQVRLVVDGRGAVTVRRPDERGLKHARLARL